jgi:signal transduction histidine kinase
MFSRLRRAGDPARTGPRPSHQDVPVPRRPDRGDDNIRVLTDTRVAEVRGADRLEEVVLTEGDSGQNTVEPGTGLFVFVGAVPHTDFLDGVVMRNERGFIRPARTSPLPARGPGLAARARSVPAGDQRARDLRGRRRVRGHGPAGGLRGRVRARCASPSCTATWRPSDVDALERLKQVGLFSDLSDDDLRRICRDVTSCGSRPGNCCSRRTIPATARTWSSRAASRSSRPPKAVRRWWRSAGRQRDRRDGAAPGGAAHGVGASTVSDRGCCDPEADAGPAARGQPVGGAAMFRVLIERMRETSERLRHSDRMAQLGTLTAGIAHELNNPAAAVRRAAQRLNGELEDYTALLAGTETAGAGLARAGPRLPWSDRPRRRRRGTLALADARRRWRRGSSSARSRSLAPGTRAGRCRARRRVARAARRRPRRRSPSATPPGSWSPRSRSAGWSPRSDEGTRRLSDIVRALKGYAFLDQGPVQDVDVVQGIEDTLVLLGHKTRHVRVQREFDPTCRGSPRSAASSTRSGRT